MPTPYKRRSNRLGWLFVGPALLHLLVFALIPIGYAFWISLYKWKIYKPDPVYVGLDNYAFSAREEPFRNALYNSFKYAVLSVPAGILVALLVAILVNQKIRGVTLFRTLYYLPAISSGVAVAMLWIYVYLPDTGLINMTMKAFGLESIDFLNKPEWAMLALAFMSIWVGLGPRMVLFLAGLVGIPQTLYEAAEIDGATGIKAFRHITVPMLVPTTLFVLVTSTIGAMQVFTPVYMMTKGGPEDTTDVVGYHIYKEAWSSFNTGLASAKSFILLAVIVVISIFQYRLMTKRLEGYSAG